LGWNIEYSPAALRHLKKLDRAMAAEVLDYMDRRVAAGAQAFACEWELEAPAARG
jgi:mRNA-degrading endonuclease RelE of RelBE toxin-antitoxin system